MQLLRTLIGCFVCCSFLFGIFVLPDLVDAYNMRQYSDRISDSGPGEWSNHTFTFTPTVAIPAGSEIEVVFPPSFTVSADTMTATSTFVAERNVVLTVGGMVRPAAATPSLGIDGVTITSGPGGGVVYEIAPGAPIAAGQQMVLAIGNQTSRAEGTWWWGPGVGTTTTATSSATTTVKLPDIEPVQNPNTLGKHTVYLEVRNGPVLVSNDFVIHLNQKVTPGLDTTEDIPPFRFNGTPTTTVGGTTLNVEIGLETDEFAVCRYSTASGTPYASMPTIFSNSGLIYHTTIVGINFGLLNTYYVRCMDDEGNINTDDFIIEFPVNDQPTGSSTSEGGDGGDGSGSGSSGEGGGDGAGSSDQDGDGGGDSDEDDSTGNSGGSSGGGGGGGRGRDDDGDDSGGGFESTNGPYQSGDGRVTITGYAYPGAKVSVLVDGYLAETVTAGGNGQYSLLIDEIARGAYTFAVYGEGRNGVKSSAFSTSFTVTGARMSTLSNINIHPSIDVEPDPVDVGRPVTVSGYALPNATITIENSKKQSRINKSVTTVSNDDGFWTTTLDSNSFSRGTYQIRAKAVQSGGLSAGFSNYTFYGVGEQSSVGDIFADLNRDGSINLIDFSIMLFWWNTNGGDSDPPADINQDGKVSLTDFSILLFNWTG